MEVFYQKYLKYKNKYLTLKKQIGGEKLNIFGNDADAVAAYIFSRDDIGVYKFGCVRKAYRGAKIGGSTGAAGTNPKYWGKWTSVGGGMKGRKNHLDAIIDEINGETNSYFDSHKVDLTKLIGRRPIASPQLICHLAQKIDKTGVFLFEISDYKIFTDIFPTLGSTNETLMKKSLGEIDAICSFSMSEIDELQSIEIKTNKNNYFIKYFLTNLQRAIVPKISEISPEFAKRWSLNTIVVTADTTERIPIELLHPPYKSR